MLDSPIVVGLGELLWDCFPEHRRPGGAPANVVFHSRQLGERGLVCTRVGKDERGHELLDYLAENGLEIQYVQRDAHRPTGWVTVNADRANDPSYTIHENVAWDYLEPQDALLTLMQKAAAVCFGTLAQRNAASRETIHQALAATRPECLRVYDVNLRQQWYQREWIHDSLNKATICKLNQSEVNIVSDLLELNAPEPRAFAAAIQQRYPVRLVCVTRAEQGCMLIDGESVATAAPPQVQVVDAVGAGDSTTAALIHAQLHDWPLEATCQLANAIGALVVQRQGAMPRLEKEFAQLLSIYAPAS